MEFPTMKDAERATYSFISALETGHYVDVKSAILNNRGGGALQTEEEKALRNARLAAQQQQAMEQAEAVEAEKRRLADIAAEREKARLAKVAALKDDWKAGDICWAAVSGGKWVQVEVVRATPVGVTYKTGSGAMTLTEAKKLREENPDGCSPPPPKQGKTGGRGRAQNGNAPRGRGGVARGAGRGREKK